MPDSLDLNPSWFALQVKPRHEKTVAEGLRQKGLEDFYPRYMALRRWSDRVKQMEMPLFPRYVFCRFDRRQSLMALKTPGVVSILGIGKAPLPVADAEISALKAIVQSHLPAQPWPFLRIGQPVRLEYGPLAGLEGILLDFKDRCRVVVSVTLLQRSVAVEIERCWTAADRADYPIAAMRTPVEVGSPSR
jgi:transcription antitermination factor NusG